MSKNLNERDTYLIKAKDGRVVDTARVKAQANILKQKQESILKEDIIIEKVKNNGKT